MKSKPNKIFIYGVPGTGKTYLSRKLGEKLGLPVFEGDKLKSKLRKTVSKEESPFLYMGTCSAYKKFGSLTEENAIKGLIAVRAALREAVINEAKKSSAQILEAAFLDPAVVKKLGKVVLITTNDEEKHKKQFFRHREKLLDFFGSQFKAARIIQKYLVEEAEKLKIQIMDNDGTSQIAVDLL